MSDPAALEESASPATPPASPSAASATSSANRPSAPRVATVCFVQDETAGVGRAAHKASVPSAAEGSLEEGPFNVSTIRAQGGGNALRFRNRSSDARKNNIPGAGFSPASADSGIDSPGCAHEQTATEASPPADEASTLSAFGSARSSLSARSVAAVDHDGSIYSYGDQTPPALYAPKKRVRQLDRTPPRFYGVADEDKEGEAVVDELSELFSGLWSRLTGGDRAHRGRHHKARLFDSDTPTVLLGRPRLQAMLPALTVFVLAASSVFTVLALRAAVDRSGVDMASMDYFSSFEIPNGKYASIEFGSRRRREVLLKEGRLLPEEVTEETGARLGGKRAAIQFAHGMANEGDLTVAQAAGEKVEEARVSQGQKVVNVDEGDKADEKKELLDKISKFGQFDTIKAEPKSLKTKEQAVNDPPATESDEKWEMTTLTSTEVKPVFVKSPGQAFTTPQAAFEDEGGSSTREQTWVEEEKSATASPHLVEMDDDAAGKAVKTRQRRVANEPDRGSRFRKIEGDRNAAAFASASDEDDPFRFVPDH